MNKQTIASRLAAYFLATGYVEVPSKSNYRIFSLSFVPSHGDEVRVRYVFVGNNGAVRVNIDHKTVTGSFSKTEEYKVILAKWEAKKEKFIQRVSQPEQRMGDRRLTKSGRRKDDNGNGNDHFKRNIG